MQLLETALLASRALYLLRTQYNVPAQNTIATYPRRAVSAKLNSSIGEVACFTFPCPFKSQQDYGGWTYQGFVFFRKRASVWTYCCCAVIALLVQVSCSFRTSVGELRKPQVIFLAPQRGKFGWKFGSRQNERELKKETGGMTSHYFINSTISKAWRSHTTSGIGHDNSSWTTRFLNSEGI